MDKRERFLGAIFGLAYGDALSFPALFHRFQAPAIPRRRHKFLWRNNSELDEMYISRLMMPFTHRIEKENLEICPTDDSEWVTLTMLALIEANDNPTQESFEAVWHKYVVPAAEVRSSFSERAAIENFKRGLKPPATGNDNPLHWEDCAVTRAVPIGLYCTGNAKRAAQFAEWDAQITQAEDGIYAAKAMAVAIALLADGATLSTALDRAREEFPKGSWIAHVDGIAQNCLKEAGQPEDLIILLTEKVINSVYSYGSVAPETLPAAFVIAKACEGHLHWATSLGNGIAKSADSVPAMLGAICGTYQGNTVISPMWRNALSELRGLCLPFLAGKKLEELTLYLLQKVDYEKPR
jgi:ADP-ribosylglycohydrolase